MKEFDFSENKAFIVQVFSAGFNDGNYAKITIDSKPIEITEN